MSGAKPPDRRWRPSDADRERYLDAISAAFADGRITADDMQSRTGLVYKATTIADLDELVRDIPIGPGPSAPRVASPRAPMSRASRIVLYICLVILGLGVVNLFIPKEVESEAWFEDDFEEDIVVVEEVEAFDLEIPELATEQDGMLTEPGLDQLWEVVSDAGVAEIHSITVRADAASLEVRPITEAPGLDVLTYRGGIVSPRASRHQPEGAEPGFFGWDDVSPSAVARAIDATPEAGGSPDAEVTHAVVKRSVFADGAVVIDVYVDDGRGGFYISWDSTGSAMLSMH